MEKKIKQLTLRDVGKEVKLDMDYMFRESPRVQVIMAIKAPKGKCFIFKSLDPLAPERQARAIRAFMQQHRRK